MSGRKKDQVNAVKILVRKAGNEFAWTVSDMGEHVASGMATDRKRAMSQAKEVKANQLEQHRKGKDNKAGAGTNWADERMMSPKGARK